MFVSVATWNLGSNKMPTTTSQLTAGQSFYVDFGAPQDVKSVMFLVKFGAYNVTISSGSPGSWQEVAVNRAYPYSTQWSEEYNKWHEEQISRMTQYLKVDFNHAGYSTVLAEVAVINQAGQQVQIQSINNAGEGSPNLQFLIDEQDHVEYATAYMSNTYFDEIYFVKTAEQYLNNQFPYEWTHPPLGKLIQASGIAAFGFTPFGWRIMGVIFATLMIALIYLLGKELTGLWIGGFAAAFLLTFDFMHFTMARMGTADTYVVFFSLASQVFFFVYLRNVLKEGWKTSTLPLFLAVVFFGLGFSSKWLVLYGFLGQLSILVVLRLREAKNVKGTLMEKVFVFLDRPYSTVVVAILVAVGIYFATYIPDMLVGRSFLDVVGLQGSMYAYHSTLTATHSFSSPWFSWPLMFNPVDAGTHVPVWFQSASLPDGLRSTIVLLGNPAVWWVGFAAVVFLTIIFLNQTIRRLISHIKHTTQTIPLKQLMPIAFIVILFFFQWVPYVFISRVVFIYHFYVNVPFLCLASAYVISKFWHLKWVKLLAIIYFALVAALFVMFFPVISGIPTLPEIINSLKWGGSWVF